MQLTKIITMIGGGGAHEELASAYTAFSHNYNESLMRTVRASVIFGPVQCRAKEMSRWVTARAVDVEIFEKVAHLGCLMQRWAHQLHNKQTPEKEEKSSHVYQPEGIGQRNTYIDSDS